MNKIDINIVKGEPKHASEVADLLPQTAPDTISYIYKNKLDVSHNIVTACWQRNNTVYSHKFGTIALEGDKVVGVLIGYGSVTYQEQLLITAGITEPFINNELMSHMKNVLR